MQFGIYAPNFGAFSDSHTLAQLAYEAEEAGWDGFFLWDHSHYSEALPLTDPAIALTAMALRTQRLRLGPLVTPLPSRNPWQLARQAVGLDRVSNGRFVQGVGLGVDWWKEYSGFGMSADDVLHGAMLDEGLAVLTGLWSGTPFSYNGTHYQISQIQFQPAPIQKPRIPVWVGGLWPNKRPFRRAANYDGIFPIGKNGNITPADVREMLTYIHQFRTATTPFDIVLRGATPSHPARATSVLNEYVQAGVTWWLEGFGPNDSTAQLSTRIRKGPPEL